MFVKIESFASRTALLQSVTGHESNHGIKPAKLPNWDAGIPLAIPTMIFSQIAKRKDLDMIDSWPGPPKRIILYLIYSWPGPKPGLGPSRGGAQAGPGPKPGLAPSRAWALARGDWIVFGRDQNDQVP